MNFMETQFDMEAFESAISQINYYINIPSFIKGNTPSGKIIEEEIEEENNGQKADLFNPAHVVNGAITVINGRLNMPRLVAS